MPFFSFGGELIHIETVRAPGILAAIGARRLVVVGDEDRTRDAPIGAVGAMAALRATLGVLVPLAEQPIGVQKMRRDRPPAAAAERDQALGVRIGRGAEDRRMRLLERLDDAAQSDLRPARLRSRDVPEFPRQIVRRFAGPQRHDVVDRLGKHGAAIGVEQLHRFHVGSQHAGADAEHQAAFQQIIDAARPASRAAADG